MVKEFGMSEKVGLRTHHNRPNELLVFNDLSPATNELIDNEIKKLIQVKMHAVNTFLIFYIVNLIFLKK